MIRRAPALLLALVALAVAGCSAGCFGRTGGDDGSGSSRDHEEVDGRPQGGAIRVGTWMRPEHDQPTSGGAAVRSLVHPQLFTVAPDGTWHPSLIDGASVAEAADRMSVTFRIRTGAAWSNGDLITAEDLRRAYDRSAVAGIDDPDADGRITVRFTAPLLQWQRLWSFDDTVAPPAVGVWGGPWMVKAMTPGLEAILVPNPRWWGSRPVLDELRLVVVPDPATALQLLERGELDVVDVPAFTGRTGAIAGVDGVRSDTTARTGWWFGLHADPTGLDLAARRAVQSTVLRPGFVDGLLGGEADAITGLVGRSDSVWATGTEQPVLRAGRADVQLLAREEEPMVGVLHKSMARRATTVGWRTELVAMEADEAEARFRERRYGVAAFSALDPPQVCWRCRWGWFDDGVATLADAGDAGAAVRLQERLRDEGIVLPLWRPWVTVAWRPTDVAGVQANGFAHTVAWNAHRWWVPR